MVLSRAMVKKQRGRRLLTVLAAAGLVGGILLAYSTVLAVNNTGAFELDGNAVTSHAGTGAPDDADRVCYQNAINTVASGGLGLTAAQAKAKCFANGDPAAPDATGTNGASAATWIDSTTTPIIFTGGGSKDPQDPQNSWLWKPSDTIPDKDTILHAFASRYSLPPSASTCPSNGAPTCEVIFFGSDRFDNSGDAQLGFWFFRGAVSRTNTASNGGFTFTGHHTDGDLLVLSDFSGGGVTSTITAYFWDHTCGSDNTTANKIVNNPGPQQCGANNLRLQATSANANCATSNATAAFCGIANPDFATTGTTHEIAPWSFTDKKGNVGVYDQNEYYEAGINLSALNIGSECFSSFEGESRSSQSPTATLKALVIGNFGHCGSTFSTTPSITTAQIPTNTQLSVTDSANLGVTGISTWSGSLDFYLCGPSAVTCSSSTGTHIGSTMAVNQSTPNLTAIQSDAATVTSVGNYCWAGVFTSATNGVPSQTDASSGECFSVTPVTPTIPTTASGSVLVGNPVSDSAALTGTAHEPGSPIIQGPVGAAAGGSITFKLYGPQADPANPVCTGTPVFTSSAIPVSGDASYGSGNFTPTSAGTYEWIASYTGDSPNTNGVTGTCGASGEVVVVTPGQPIISTTAVAGPLALGNPISDTAHLSNVSTPSNATAGTITFKAYGPATTTTDCSTLAYTSVVTVTLVGNGDYTSSSGTGGVFTPTLPGTYNWTAAYAPAAGDANNLSATTACGDATEASVIISLQPSMTTAQRFVPNDSATVTVASGAGNLNGNVDFQLFVGNTTCTGAATYDSGNIDITTGTPNPGTAGLSKTVSSSNTVAYATSGTTFSWKVTYVSSNAGHKNVTATCNAENSSITIANGGTFNTP